jgi:hypothetical protein
MVEEEANKYDEMDEGEVEANADTDVVAGGERRKVKGPNCPRPRRTGAFAKRGWQLAKTQFVVPIKGGKHIGGR